MKKCILLLAVFYSCFAFGQSADERAVLGNTRKLHNTVFGTRDSATLDKLFSIKLSYGHSGGKLETKPEAIAGITHNQSTYADLTISSITLWVEGNTIVARHSMSATEKKKDGTSSPLKLHIMLVWVKEKSEWKLLARQAVKSS